MTLMFRVELSNKETLLMFEDGQVALRFPGGSGHSSWHYDPATGRIQTSKEWHVNNDAAIQDAYRT